MSVLGMEFSFDPARREVLPLSDDGAAFLEKLGFYFEHSAIWYLAVAKDMALTGRHIRPESLRGGQNFFDTTHELPLKELALKYGAGEGRELFLKMGMALGGRAVGFGDAAVELHPLPRVPVTLILWMGDDEFPPRADLLFDSSADYHAPLDVLWSAAMLTALAML
jgi:hypothetical protein